MSIEPYNPPSTPALINPATDSWTAVLADVVTLAQNINQTEFVPKDLRGSAPKVAAAILHGRELGLPPMTALAGVHIINGRPGISAELMRALILQAGHELKFTKSTAAQCVMRGRRAGDDDWTEVAYTLQEAKDAGDYTKNPNYRTRPADMLTARATTRLARMIFADIIHGMRSLEELQDMVEGDQTPLTVEQVETTTVSRQPPRAAAVEGADPTPIGTAQPEGGATVPGVGDAPPSPPQRKRAPLKPRQAEPPADETPSEDDNKTSNPAPDVQRPPITTIEERHHKAVQATVMHFNRLGITDRDDRLHWTGILTGRTIRSTIELNLGELRSLIGKLERIKNRDGLLDLIPTDEPDNDPVPPDRDTGPATGAATETTAAAPPPPLFDDDSPA